MINLLLFVTYVLIAVGLLACIVFPLIYMLKNPKGAKKSFIGIAGILILFVICYAISSSEVLPMWSEKFGITEGASKRIGGALIMFYVIMAGALIMAVLSEVKGLIKR